MGEAQARAPWALIDALARAEEKVRRTLAQRTGCQSSRHSPGILALADTVANDHTAVSEKQVNPLLDEFTVPQVVELLIRIAFECATGPFGFLIGDEPATAKPRDAFAASITKP